QGTMRGLARAAVPVDALDEMHDAVQGGFADHDVMGGLAKAGLAALPVAAMAMVPGGPEAKAAERLIEEAPIAGERVLGPALRLDNEIYSTHFPKTHQHVITEQLEPKLYDPSLGNKASEPYYSALARIGDQDEGFVTTHRKFVSRDMGGQIQEANGQPITRAERNRAKPGDLHSYDVINAPPVMTPPLMRGNAELQKLAEQYRQSAGLTHDVLPPVTSADPEKGKLMSQAYEDLQ